MQHIIGVHLGTTRVTAAAGRAPVGSAVGEPLARELGPGDVGDKLLPPLLELISRAASASGLTSDALAGVGVAVAADVNRATGTVWAPHRWSAYPLAERLSAALERPVRIESDAVAAAVAESRAADARDDGDLLCVLVDSEVRAALLLSGQVRHAPGRFGTALGQLRPGTLPRHVPSPGGTVDSVASASALVTRAVRAIEDWEGTVAFVRSRFPDTHPSAGRTDPAFHGSFSPMSQRFETLLRTVDGDRSRIDAAAVLAAAGLGDQLSCELLSDAAWSLGWAIAQCVALCGLGRVVVGGLVAEHAPEILFWESIRRTCRSQLPHDYDVPLEIVPPSCGPGGALQGMLALAAEQFLPGTPLHVFHE